MNSAVIFLLVVIACISSDCNCSVQKQTSGASVIDKNIIDEESSELKKLRIKFELLEGRLISLEKFIFKSSKESPVCTINNYATPHHNDSNDSNNSNQNDLLQKVELILEKLSNIENYESSDCSDCTTNQRFNKIKRNKRTRGKYLGCFKDSAEHRGLRGYARPSSSNTVEKCIEICRNGSYVYAGLQATFWCLCGNTNQNPIKNVKLSYSNCGTPCPGNATQSCGNSWINEIYETGIEQLLIDEDGRQLPESYIEPSIHSYFFLNHDGAVEN